MTTAKPGIWPLTQAQRGLWFLDSFNAGSAFYVVSFGIRLRGRLDVDALRVALNRCIARQDALRTRFVTLDGHPYQVVPRQPMDLPVVDLTGLAGPQAEAAVQQRCDLAADTPFDLTADPLIRTECVRLAEDHHVLVLAVHHIVFDAWSARIFLAELAAAYDSSGSAPTLN